MITQFSIAAITALAIAQCFAGSAVALSASSSSQDIEEGFSTAAWTPLSTANYTIASSCNAQEWNITQDKTSASWLHFSSIDLASGAQLVVSALDGSASQTLESQTSGVTTTPIPGNGVTLQFVPPTDGCNTSTSSILLDAVGYEFVEERHVLREDGVTWGTKDAMENVMCYAYESHADKVMVKKAEAVMRTQRKRERDNKSRFVCTAWLWGNKGHIITNNHCFSSQEMVDAAKFCFNVQTNECNVSCTSAACPIGESLVGKGNVKFIKSDPTLDYAVLKITTDAKHFVSTYGYLKIRLGEPVLGEEIYIPQHPHGKAKMIVTTDDDLGSKVATIHYTDYTVVRNGTTYSHLIAYTADAIPGSSGSREDNTVVGLHRMSSCHNIIGNLATRVDQLATIFSSIVSDKDGYSK